MSASEAGIVVPLDRISASMFPATFQSSEVELLKKRGEAPSEGLWSGWDAICALNRNVGSGQQSGLFRDYRNHLFPLDGHYVRTGDPLDLPETLDGFHADLDSLG